MCYSPIESDARVTNQIRWLEAAGYSVDVLSRGPNHPLATGRHFKIGYPKLWQRLIAYALLPPKSRFKWVVEKEIPKSLLADLRYEIVLVNDLQLLPWAVNSTPKLAKGEIILDLHEVYSGNGASLLYKLLFSRYDEWLLTFISSGVFTRRLTVAEGIADLYHDEYGIPRPGVIRNVAPYEELEPSLVDDTQVKLIHHGYASVERGIDIMLDASLMLEPRFKFVLMVLGDKREINRLRRHPAITTGRAEFRSPVGVEEVAKALNDCDLEVIFFPPRFANNKYALPNKFFEAVQGRLGIVIGESPEIVPFVRERGLGIVVEGWEASDLAQAVNQLSIADIKKLKTASDRSAAELSTRGECPRFLELVGA